MHFCEVKTLRWYLGLALMVLSACSKHTASVEEELEKAKAIIVALETEKVNDEKFIDVLNAELNSIQVLLDSIDVAGKNPFTDATIALKRPAQKIMHIDSLLTQSKQRIRKLDSLLQNTNQRIGLTAKRLIEELRKKVEVYEEENIGLKAENSQLSGELEYSKAALSETNVELSSLRLSNEDLAKERDSIKWEIQRLAIELQENQNALEEAKLRNRETLKNSNMKLGRFFFVELNKVKKKSHFSMKSKRAKEAIEFAELAYKYFLEASKLGSKEAKDYVNTMLYNGEYNKYLGVEKPLISN